MNYDRNRIEDMRGYRRLLEQLLRGGGGITQMEMHALRQHLIKTYGQDEVIQAENEVERQQELSQ